MPRLAIGAIVRNEGPYLLEWIAFHRVLGVEPSSSPTTPAPTTALLAALAAAGVVRHLPFPDLPDRRPQLPAYENPPPPSQ